MELLNQTLKNIRGLNSEIMEEARVHQDNLTKPKGSLGRLEELAVKICGIRAELNPKLAKKRVVVFAGDHGVVSQGVSAYPKEVTSQMVYNFLNQGAGINAIASAVGAEVEVVDIGVDYDFPDLPGLVKRKIRKSTRDFTQEPALTMEETIQAIEVGIERAKKAKAEGVGIIAGGDMGIGNTTSASCLFCAYLGLKPEQVVGAGTGLAPDKIKRKIMVVKKALALHKGFFSHPLETLSALSGLEIAGLAGLFLGAVEERMVVLVDGFIATASALSASKLCPMISEHLIFSHLSEELGHKLVLERMGAKPLLDLSMRLGEGTGACLAMAIIDSALACHNKMATFKSAKVSEKI